MAAHYIRPVARDEHGHVQRLGPAVLATWDADHDRFEHFAWGITPELALRVGRTAGDFELEVDRRRDYLAGLADAGIVEVEAVRAAIDGYRSTDHRSHQRPRHELRSRCRHPAAPATLAELRAARLAVADRQGGAARQPARPPRDGRAEVLPGIVGYEETVIPAIENAILAGQDIVFLGERGQAKTRMARLLVGLLDEWLPVVARRRAQRRPVRADQSPPRRAIVDARGRRRPPIDWLPRDRRYAEKLATPDITIADLIGEVDPIKVAEGRYLSDELTIHYGLIPRANRGIFAINELPDLAERIQVGLLNILEERDVQIRGYTIRLPLDLFVVASANPEDYTSRGRIITPLKDRLGSQIRTHYPRTLEHEIAIMRQEQQRFADGRGHPAGRRCPAFMDELVAELTHLARRSPGDQPAVGRLASGCRVANMEVLEAAALKRAVRLGEPPAAPRVSRPAARSSPRPPARSSSRRSATRRPRSAIVERLMTKALYATFNRRVDVDDLDAGRRGVRGRASSSRPASGCRRASTSRWMREVPGLRRRGRAARHVRRDRRRRGAGGRRLGGRVPARGAAPRPAAEQGARSPAATIYRR